MSSRIALSALVVALFAAAGPAAAAANTTTPIYLDRSYSFEERAADLVSRMTVEEKASQMISSKAPAIPRLGIPAYGWWNEALHGVSRLQYEPDRNATVLINTTSYPISHSLGASWDPDLMYREASAISDEAREVVPDNRLNLDFYSPTVNLARDPRWGRNDEAFSEDPFLTAAIAGQFVNGMEGKDRRGRPLRDGNGYLKSITTIKHYAANNSEVNRRTGSSDMDQRTLREYYTDQFARIVRMSQPGSVMSSYNEVNGEPTSASVPLIDNLMRQTFGFRGYFTSDCDSVFEMMRSHRWTPPGWTHPVDHVERNALAIAAGEDLNCNQGYHDEFNYANTVPDALRRAIQTQTGTFNIGDVDTALTRLFTARMRLGEFDPADRQPWVTEARSRVTRGSWVNSDANGAVTMTPERLALAREAGAKSLVLLKNQNDLLPLKVPRSGPFKVAVMGYLANPDELFLGGYSSTHESAGVAKQVNGYEGIAKAIHAINPEAVVDYHRGFTGTGTTADSLTEVDPAAVEAADDYDYVIVYAGTDDGTADEDADRETLALPGAQGDLINRVGARNPHTVAVIETIGQVEVSSFEPNVPAMLWSSYNGQRKGESLADVLLGRYNPSARLPFIWYRGSDQLPPITDYAIRPDADNPGRTYMYFDGPLAYPFGYGLSYTDFKYSNLRIDRTRVDADDAVQVHVDVTNSGGVRGAEVVQLYVTTPDAPASLERPRKRLRAFKKVALAPGQTRRVKLTVDARDLAFFDDETDRYIVDPGRYGVQIATSSADADVRQQGFVWMRGRLKPRPDVVTVKPALAGDARRDVAQRVVLPPRATVVPRTTVAMTDESLYGYITKGRSRPLPRGTMIRYRSNRPHVVSVGRRGRIRTVRPGVATVTATVAYHGATAKGRFVVRVRSG